MKLTTSLYMCKTCKEEEVEMQDTECTECQAVKWGYTDGNLPVYDTSEDDDCESDWSERPEPAFHEVTNEHGFFQLLDDEGHAVCCQCHCLVMPNRGQGALCSTCDYDAFIESEHDYDMM